MKRVFLVTALIAALLCCCAALAEEVAVDMPTTVPVGQDVVITFREPEKYRRIYADVSTINHERLAHVDGFDGNITLPNYLFDAGSYEIRISAFRNDTGANRPITAMINVSGSPRKTGPEITPSKTTADVDENVSFTIHKSGAERFMVWRFACNEQGNRYSIGIPQEVISTDQFERVYSGSYGKGSLTVFAAAYVDGAWTAISQCRVNVNEALKLETPVCELPADVELGEPILLTIHPVANAQYYKVNIYYQNGDWYSGTSFETAVGPYYILDITEDNSYNVFVSALADGWEESDRARLPITVFGQPGPEVSLDKEEYRINEEVAVTASLPGADQFKIQVQLYENDQLYSTWQDEIIDAVNGTAEYWQYLYNDLEGKTLVFHVRARVNGVWTAATVARAKVQSEERLATPALTLPANSVTAGMPVQVEIGEVADASRYSVRARNTDTGSYMWLNFYEAGTHTLDGLADPGQYKISVTAYPEYDAQVIESKPSADATLTLTGTLEPGPTVSADKADCAAGSEFTATASLPGAEKFCFSHEVLKQDGSRWSSGNDNSAVPADADGCASRTHYPYNEQVGMRYVVYARALINGRWTAAGEVSVNIVDKDAPETPAMLTPDFVLPGGLTAIEDSAFEGIGATVVYVADGCSSIGANAFGNCSSLKQLRLPKTCAVDATAFDGCRSLTAIFAPAGGAAETWAQTYISQHSGCVFVPETH